MELIRNGYFDSGELEPWRPCAGMALEGGGVTDDNFVFLSLYNLRLTGNDCVRQELPYLGRVDGGELSLWTAVHADEWSSGMGRLEARIEYSDGGERDTARVDYHTLHDREHPYHSYPYKLHLPVDADRYVSAVQLRCVDSVARWYVCAVSMEGSHVFPSGPREMRYTMRMEDRIAGLERRLMRLERAMAGVDLRPRKRPEKT